MRAAACGAVAVLVWMMADCASRSAHSRSNVAASIQVPSHAAHSSRSMAPTDTQVIALVHPGHFDDVGALPSMRSRATPQCGQKRDPANSTPRHFGHDTVARRERQ